MKVLNLSSGGTKFIGIVGAAKKVLASGFKPDVITGVSAGAVAAVPVALDMWDDMIHKGLNLELSDMFKVAPITNNGSLRFNTCLITKGCFGISRIDELISEFISFKKFQEYKFNDKYPECYVQTVRMSTRAKHVWALKSLNYKLFLNVVAASAAIPIYTQGIWINDQEHYDGGLRDSTVSWWVLENLNPTEIVSIYSKSPYNKPDNTKDTHSPGFKYVFKTISKTIECLVEEGMLNDAELEREICKSKNIKLTQYMLPNVMKNYYDTDKSRLKELYSKSQTLDPVWQS